MGCDIHEMIEIKKEYGWENAGSCDINRNYNIFSILANVRNNGLIQPIDYTPLKEGDYGDYNCSEEFDAVLRKWEGDAHSAGSVTLRQIKEYNIKTIEDLWTVKEWKKILNMMKKIKSVYNIFNDENIRLVFFFDN